MRKFCPYCAEIITQKRGKLGYLALRKAIHELLLAHVKEQHPTMMEECRCAGPKYDPDTPCPVHPKTTAAFGRG